MSQPGVAPPVGQPPPLVSVVLPVYNYETYIEETVESVLAQTHERWELLLVDDGSSDASPKIARRYAERHPERVRYLEHPGGENRGCPASRNLGIRHARGEYVAFLDADDVWLPTKLAMQVALLRTHPEAAMTYGPSQWWYSWTGAPDDAARDYTQDLGIPPGTLVGPPALLAHFLRNGKTVPPPSAVLATREAVERAGGFEESFRGSAAVYEDQAFYAKVALAEPVLVGGDVHCRFRKHSRSMGATTRQTRSHAVARLAYLTWLEGHLASRGVTGGEVWTLVHEELWRRRHRRVAGHAARIRRVHARARQELAALARRTLSTAGVAWVRDRWRSRRIDLGRVVTGDGGVHRGRSWRDIPDDAPAMHTSLAQSTPLRFLAEYASQGEGLFAPGTFERTEYYRLARQWAVLDGVEEAGAQDEHIRGQARAFVTLYARTRDGDPTEVAYFREARRHSRAGARPVVRQTLTPGVYQIVDGHHRLAIAWFLGRRRARVTVLPPMPTDLQLLVLAAEDNGGRRLLHQPIERPEFDRSWPVEVPCEERLAAMRGYLEGRASLDRRPTVLDLGCSYGWFVSRFAAAGYRALGVDADPAVLKIGRLAFGLRTEHLAQSAPAEFVARCERSFDVVLVSGGLRARRREEEPRDLGTFLARVDAITGSCLFVDAARLEELRRSGATRRPDTAALVAAIETSTSFDDVAVLGDGPRPLIACSRRRR